MQISRAVTKYILIEESMKKVVVTVCLFPAQSYRRYEKEYMIYETIMLEVTREASGSPCWWPWY